MWILVCAIYKMGVFLVGVSGGAASASIVFVTTEWERKREKHISMP